MGKQRRRGRPEATPAPATAAPPPDGTSTDWQSWVRRSWFAPALYALVALVYFWQFPLSDKIIFGQDVGTDFHKGKAPVVEKLKELEPSAWDPRMGGYPISDEIRHKFFPTYLIELFTTKQRTIGWRYMLVVFAAGWGMFLYLRQIGVGRGAALWGGFAFLSAPTFLTFPYAGQYAKMSVIALFPFLCLCVERGMDGGLRASRWWILMAVLIAIGVFTPHLQMLQYALLGTGAYFLYKVVVLYREGMAKPVLGQRVVLFGVAAALGLGLGAEGAFPPYLHVKTQSKRAAIQDETGRSEAEQLAHARSWSLHPEEVASLVIPEFVGFIDPADPNPRTSNHYWGRNPMKLNSEYFGILPLILGIVAVPWARRRPLVLFLALLFVFSLAFTLGGHTPVHWLAYHLIPGGKVLRSIGMAAFLFAFPAVVLAALALQRVLDADGDEGLARRILTVGGVLTGLALITALAPSAVLSAWESIIWRDMPPGNRAAMLANAAWIGRGAFVVACVAGAGTALLFLRLKGRIGAAPLLLGLALLTVGDTWRIDKLFLQYEDPSRWTDFRQANPATTAFLKAQPGRFRLYPFPGFGFLSDHRFHLPGADIATAFNNYTLRRYDRLLQNMRGIEQRMEATFRGQQTEFTQQQLLEAARPLLSLVNARYIVTPGPYRIDAPGFPEVFASEGVRLYENASALPWFELLPHAQVVDSETAALEAILRGQVDLRTVALLEEEPPIDLPGPGVDRSGDRVVEERYDYHEGVIRVRTRSEGARLLRISDNYHPHWSATVDGEPVPILRADYIWRVVPVPAGDHVVELTYHSRPVAIARTAAGLCLVILLGWAVWDRRRASAEADDSASGASMAPGKRLD